MNKYSVTGAQGYSCLQLPPTRSLQGFDFQREMKFVFVKLIITRWQFFRLGLVFNLGTSFLSALHIPWLLNLILCSDISVFLPTPHSYSSLKSYKAMIDRELQRPKQDGINVGSGPWRPLCCLALNVSKGGGCTASLGLWCNVCPPSLWRTFPLHLIGISSFHLLYPVSASP